MWLGAAALLVVLFAVVSDMGAECLCALWTATNQLVNETTNKAMLQTQTSSPTQSFWLCKIQFAHNKRHNRLGVRRTREQKPAVAVYSIAIAISVDVGIVAKAKAEPVTAAVGGRKLGTARATSERLLSCCATPATASADFPNLEAEQTSERQAQCNSVHFTSV